MPRTHVHTHLPDQAELLAALRQVNDPELGRNIVELGMVKELVLEPDGKVHFTLSLTAPGCPMREQIAGQARAALLALKGIIEVQVTFGSMSLAERQQAFGNASPSLPKLSQFNKVERVIAVLSGKGGVGKSSLTALLACGLARRGLKTGILDADMTGPSIPRLFGLPPGGLPGSAQGILPAVSCSGIRVMSTNLLIKEEDMPLIWRGPVITGTIRQFWEDVIWGRLDTLLVDMPPGTSDAALTVLKSLPVSGVVLVTTPQELAAMVVRKAVRMLQELNIPVLGVVENMSYFECPDCGKRHEIFGPSHAQEIADAARAPLWARMPIRPEVTALADAGKIEDARLAEVDELCNLLIKKAA
jgi:Mrp family chromosome partitioning ATPase